MAVCPFSPNRAYLNETSFIGRKGTKPYRNPLSSGSHWLPTELPAPDRPGAVLSDFQFARGVPKMIPPGSRRVSATPNPVSQGK